MLKPINRPTVSVRQVFTENIKPATANGITSLEPENVPTDQTIWLNNEKAIIFSCHPAPANGNSDIKNDPVAGSTTLTDPVPTVPVPVAAIEYTSSKTAASNQVDLTQPENDYMYGVEYKNDTYQENQPYANNGNNMPNGNKGPWPNSQHRPETCFCQTPSCHKERKQLQRNRRSHLCKIHLQNTCAGQPRPA